MKFLLLIYSNPQSREIWSGLTPEQRAVGLQDHADLVADLEAEGALVVSEALAEVARTKQVTVREGRTLVSDGPFAEVKEHLAGFYLIECATVEQATEYAARIPDAQHSVVEVRPVMTLGEMGL